MSAIVVGQKAPEFSLADETGKKVKLSDFAGQWVVLYFYPRDNTPGCTTEACEFTGRLAQFEKLEAKVLGCSPDSPESHQKFIEKQELKITLLSDPDHAVMERYGVWGEKNLYGKVSMGVIRSTVIIDPAGKIAHHYPKVKAEGHAGEVRAKLVELRG
ncbi:MAG TPA: thioredoxin-dependent thiol peroxidase [Polyangia bacterium]